MAKLDTEAVEKLKTDIEEALTKVIEIRSVKSMIVLTEIDSIFGDAIIVSRYGLNNAAAIDMLQIAAIKVEKYEG